MDIVKNLYTAEKITYKRSDDEILTIVKHPEGWELEHCGKPVVFSSLEEIIDTIFGWEKNYVDSLSKQLAEWGGVRVGGYAEIRERIIAKMQIVEYQSVWCRLEKLPCFDYAGLSGYYMIHHDECENLWYYEATNSNQETYTFETNTLNNLLAEIVKCEREQLVIEREILKGWATVPEYTDTQIQAIIVGKIENGLSQND